MRKRTEILIAFITQQQLAERTGIDQAAISRIESGKGNPTLNTLEALAEGTGVTLLIRFREAEFHNNPNNCPSAE